MPVQNQQKHREVAVASLVDIRVIDVAPAPFFASLGRLNDRVLRSLEVFPRVTILGRITTTHVAALGTHAQMHPRVSSLHTLFTALRIRLDRLDMLFYMRALCHDYHSSSLRLYHSGTGTAASGTNSITTGAGNVGILLNSASLHALSC